MSLFRPEALAHKQTTWLGTIVLIRPISFAALSLLALMVAIAVVVFFGWGEYTKKARVTGQLTPETGVVKLYARESALVRDMRIKEGQQVKSGDILFALAPERIAASGSDANAIASTELVSRRAALTSELAAQDRLLREQLQAVTRRAAESRHQLAQLEVESRTQAERVHLAELANKRVQELSDKGFVSPTQLEQKQADWLNEVARTQAIARSQFAAQRELAALAQEARELPVRAMRDRAGLDRALASLRQESGDR
ncbi:MAG: biotin/lipoyl-binding protein [Betaproteobacteria bacterium]|nr:biotin/lipoyl-binding protein [Betaproteobacteria bacterium]